MESWVKGENTFLVCEVDNEYILPKGDFSYAKWGLYVLIQNEENVNVSMKFAQGRWDLEEIGGI